MRDSRFYCTPVTGLGTPGAIACKIAFVISSAKAEPFAAAQDPLEKPMPIDIRSLCPLLAVYDMPTSLRFYRDLLGFEIHQTSDPKPDGHIDWVWLRRNDANLMLNTMFERNRRPQQLDPARVAAHGDTQIYMGFKDLDAAAQTLQAAGVAVKGPIVRPFGMKQLFFRDPDNYELCLQWSA